MASEGWPRYEVSVLELADALGITDRQIQKLAKQLNLDGSPVVFKMEKGSYDLIHSLVGYRKWLQDKGAAPSEDDDGLDPRRERARLHKAQADKVEMENAVRAGEYVHIEDVRRAWLEIVTILNGQIDAIPGRMSGTLAALVNADKARVYDILLGESLQIRDSIANGLATLGHHPGNGTAGDPPA